MNNRVPSTSNCKLTFSDNILLVLCTCNYNIFFSIQLKCSTKYITDYRLHTNSNDYSTQSIAHNSNDSVIVEIHYVSHTEVVKVNCRKSIKSTHTSIHSDIQI